MSQHEPLVTIIVPHHLNENDEYLKWCLTSILASEGVALEVFCISDAKECPEVPPNVNVIHDPTLNNATKKWNYGQKFSSHHAKYCMLISDDVMVSKHTIAELADTAGDVGMIVGPASNCDSTTRYRSEYSVNDSFGNTQKIGLKSSLEEIKGFEYGIINIPKERRLLIDPGWISFYCTLFPKTVLEKVGEFNPDMDVRWNDYQYCVRARQLGIQSVLNLGVFAWHAGDRTLPKCTTEEEYTKADEAFGKWRETQSAS